jgi:hypothetical protein
MARKGTGQRVTPDKGHSSGQRNIESRDSSIVPQATRGYNPSHITSESWTLERFNALSEEQQNTYFRAKQVIDGVRDGKSASEAALDNKTTLATVFRYFPDDFFKTKGSSRWKVTPSDKHPNQVQWLGPNGYEDWILRGSREASRQGSYLNDVKKALRGETSALDKWRGKKIGGRKLITDLDVLTRLGREGKLDFEDELLWRS